MSNSANWPVVLLKDIQAPKKHALNGGPFGSKLVRRDYRSAGVPVIRGTNVSGDSYFSLSDLVFVSEEKADELLSNNAHPGDLVFTQRGTLGQVGIIPKNCGYRRFVISQSQMKLTVDESQADPYYLYYFFRTPRTVQMIHNLSLSSGVPHINLDILRHFEVTLPPLPTQRHIAGILSAYDDLIENNARRIAILEEMAQLLYREWFVHYRFPGHEDVEMVESELGMIPERWEVGRLDDALILQRGFDLPRKKRMPGTVPVYASTGVTDTHNEIKVKAPGVVTGRSGSLGTVIYVEDDYWPLNTTLWVREFRRVTPLYAYYLLNDLHLENYNSGAAVPTLNRNDIHGLPVILPSQNVLDRFGAQILILFRMRKNLRERNDVLRRTRDLLLPRLVSGEVDVSEVEVEEQKSPSPPAPLPAAKTRCRERGVGRIGGSL